MKIWQAIGCGAVCLAAFIGMIAGVIFYATSGITDTADGFFAAVSEGEYEAAQEFTSQRLRETTSPQDLEEFVETRRLGNVVDTSWSSRSIENSTGELSGTVETQNGAVIPITIVFVPEGDEWRIDGFDVAAPGLSSGASPAQSGGQSSAPERGRQDDGGADTGGNSDQIDPAALAAANESGVPTHGWLNEAWLEGDFFMFSSVWKDRPSPASLASRYPSDGLSRAEIEELDNTGSQIESAAFDEEGRLIVTYLRRVLGRELRTTFTYVKTPGGSRPWLIADLVVDKGAP